MTPMDLEHYLHEHIPLSKAMQVSVVEIGTEQLVLEAPLAPNINHRETVFGGSASALAILAAWSLVHVRLRAARLPSRLVIQRNTMEYERPMVGTFRARASLDTGAAWSRFLRILARRGKARIHVLATLEYEGQVTGRLTGEFVALA